MVCGGGYWGGGEGKDIISSPNHPSLTTKTTPSIKIRLWNEKENQWKDNQLQDDYQEGLPTELTDAYRGNRRVRSGLGDDVGCCWLGDGINPQQHHHPPDHLRPIVPHSMISEPVPKIINSYHNEIELWDVFIKIIKSIFNHMKSYWLTENPRLMSSVGSCGLRSYVGLVVGLGWRVRERGV